MYVYENNVKALFQKNMTDKDFFGITDKRMLSLIYFILSESNDQDKKELMFKTLKELIKHGNNSIR